MLHEEEFQQLRGFATLLIKLVISCGLAQGAPHLLSHRDLVVDLLDAIALDCILFQLGVPIPALLGRAAMFEVYLRLH